MIPAGQGFRPAPLAPLGFAHVQQSARRADELKVHPHSGLICRALVGRLARPLAMDRMDSRLEKAVRVGSAFDDGVGLETSARTSRGTSIPVPRIMPELFNSSRRVKSFDINANLLRVC